MTTSKDVAKLAGTSIATVSYVFNNGPRPVSAKLRKRVLDAAETLSYSPNVSARALITGKTATFGLIVPSILNPFFGELSYAVETLAKEVGHLLLIADSSMDPDQENNHLREFVRRGVDGVLLVSCSEGSSDLGFLTSRGIPVVALHPLKKFPEVPAVYMDYINGAYSLTKHLLNVHKIRTILLVLGSGEVGSFDHKAGVLQAIDEMEFAVQESTLETEVSRKDAYSKSLALLKNAPLPEAIYCATDEQAFGVLAALNSLGFSVPRDVKVVGFDGTIHSEFSIPPLTSMRQPLEALARLAIDALILKSGDLGSEGVLKGQLVIRESCGCESGQK